MPPFLGEFLKLATKALRLAVEIDHGNGFRTRYAHLKSIKVKRGQKIDFHQVIGTDQSEAQDRISIMRFRWQNKVQNPMNFIHAGKHQVFTQWTIGVSDEFYKNECAKKQ